MAGVHTQALRVKYWIMMAHIMAHVISTGISQNAISYDDNELYCLISQNK